MMFTEQHCAGNLLMKRREQEEKRVSSCTILHSSIFIALYFVAQKTQLFRFCNFHRPEKVLLFSGFRVK